MPKDPDRGTTKQPESTQTGDGTPTPKPSEERQQPVQPVDPKVTERPRDGRFQRDDSNLKGV